MVKSFLKEDSLSTCRFTTISLIRDHPYITSTKGRCTVVHFVDSLEFGRAAARTTDNFGVEIISLAYFFTNLKTKRYSLIPDSNWGLMA